MSLNKRDDLWNLELCKVNDRALISLFTRQLLNCYHFKDTGRRYISAFADVHLIYGYDKVAA